MRFYQKGVYFLSDTISHISILVLASTFKAQLTLPVTSARVYWFIKLLMAWPRILT